MASIVTRLALGVGGMAALLAMPGCGTTKHYTATEQLLMSDAVDATIAKMDFSPLSLRRVFLDVTYIKQPTHSGQSLIIDANYMLSALRQQMVADGVLLVENREDAELIAEPRIGALGIDGHDVIYGMPASNAISNASAVVAGAPLLPPLPEISVARREDKQGAAKVAVFAYDRLTKQPYWQSGIAQSNSNSRATWVLGVGPFQQGSIHQGTQFAGGAVFPTQNPESEYEEQLREQYLSSHVFQQEPNNDNPTESPGNPTGSSVVSAGHQENLKTPPEG
jgi:hypothetical protein